MNIIVNKYKKVADFCYELFRIAEIPLYKSKFSNRKFTQFQHLFVCLNEDLTVLLNQEHVNFKSLKF